MADTPVFTDRWGGSYRLVEPGSFILGDQHGSGGRSEYPIRPVTVSQPFFMGERPITQAQWLDVMGTNPSKFQEGWSAGLRPVEQINMVEIESFLHALNVEDQDTPRFEMLGRWRLPSEVEWEYTAKAGTSTRWWFGDRDRELDDHGWHAGNSGGTTREVGSKKANPWGFFDMNGLVNEWCADAYEPNYEQPRNQLPHKCTDVEKLVVRGGAWFAESDSTRNSARSSAHPSKRSDGLGVRLVWEPVSQAEVSTQGASPSM